MSTLASTNLLSQQEWQALAAAYDAGDQVTIDRLEAKHAGRHQAATTPTPKTVDADRAQRRRAFTKRLAATLTPTVLSAGLRPATERVAAILVRLASARKWTDASVPEIAGKAGVSERMTQLATAELVRHGFLTITRRRIAHKLNDTNVYQLSGPLASCSEASTRRGGAKIFRVKRLSDSESSSTTPYQPETAAVCLAFGGKPREISEPISAPPGRLETSVATSDDSPCEWTNLAHRAIEAIEPESAAVPSPNPWADLDRLRRDRLKIPDFLWHAATQTHKHRAALAVAEALLRPANYFRKSPTAYVLGTLRKRPSECRPELSVARLVAEIEGIAKSAPSDYAAAV